MRLRRIQGNEKRLGPASAFYATVTLSLSSRPKRTRISCHAALETTACAAFSKEKPHEVRQRHQYQQEIRGSGAEGPAVPRTLRGHGFSTARSGDLRFFSPLALYFSFADRLVPASRPLSFQGLSTASRMVALAGQFCHSLRIFTDFATVFLLFGGNTATGGVCTFL
jgi:hypothetical protein